jgi:hypothetical protein
MSSINANKDTLPEDGESLKKKEKPVPKTHTVQNLLKEAIIREFGQPIDPEKFDEYKKNRTRFHKQIELHMQDLRREWKKWDTEDTWWEISDEMISSETTDTNITENMAMMAQNLVLMRKRAFDRVLELFPDIVLEKTNWSHILTEELAQLDENELKTYIGRRAYMRKIVYKAFPLFKWILPTERKDFDTLFSDKDQYLDAAWQKRFTTIYRDYKEHGQIPDTDDIGFILGSYSTASDERKKQVLTDLGVTLSIKQAISLWLIDENFLRRLATQELQDVYLTLNEEQREWFIRTLKQNENSVVVASDFDTRKLWEIFSSERKRRLLAKEIYRNMSIDTPVLPTIAEEDIAWEIRRKKLKQLDEKNEKNEELIEEEWDLYNEFIDEIAGTLKTKDGKPQIENIHVLKSQEPVIRYTHEDGGTQYVRVKRVRDENGNPVDIEDWGKNGIELEGLMTDAEGNIVKNQNFSVTYEQFRNFLRDSKDVSVLKNTEFSDLLTTNPSEAWVWGKIFDARPIISEEPITKDNIAAKLNLIDSVGERFGFEEWTSFIAPIEYSDAKKNSQEWVWTVSQILGDRVSLADPSWIVSERNIPIAQLYEFLANTPWFQRISKIKGNADMIKELAEYGAKDATLDDKWNLLVEEHHDDGHGHGEKKSTKITCFKSEKWGHIRLEFIKDGIVRFGEYDANGHEDTKVKEYAAKHGLDKNLKWLYRWRRMSYAGFLRYLEKEGLQATTDDVIIPNTHHELWHEHGHDHHHPHAHMEGSLLKRIMSWQNPASIWKGFEMIYHSIEHTLEKWAKLDAARFALSTSKMLGLPDSVRAQVYSDITSASKEIVEKYEQKIFGLPGPAGREKCIHIVHNKDSRPEEVMSAINYMLKSYGHLYAEDIKHYQPIVNKKNLETADPGYFAFFDGFVMASKIGDLKHWRKEAYKRAVKEMGTEEDHENEPTEEQLIHALCKMIDGDWDVYPYAASVIKAIGWPGWFEKAWKFEGFENAHKKWVEQTKMVNAQWRLNKSVSYLETHEIYKAMGAMESMAGKTKDPSFQAMPFIWAVWGYSRFASHAALQKLKWYAENGLSFHAYGFLRNEQCNTVYKETVKLALRELGWGKLEGEFDALCNKLEFDSSNPKKTKWAALAMMKFWKENSVNGLHDMLQWQNGWLTSMAKSWNPTVKKYLTIFHGAHEMQLKDPAIPGTDFGSDWYKEHGYQNMITAPWENGLQSLSSMLNKIRYTTTNRWGKPMDKEHEEKIWRYVNKYMKTWLRDTKSFLNNESLQKEQFLAHRQELIQHFAWQLSAWEVTDPATIERLVNAEEYGYFQDLAKLGIDPRWIFNATIAKENREADYKRWKEWTPVWWGITKKASTPDVRSSFQEKTNTVIEWRTPTDTIKPKAWPRMKRSDWDKNKHGKKEDEFTDDDLLYSGWAWDASVSAHDDDHDDHHH